MKLYDSLIEDLRKAYEKEGHRSCEVCHRELPEKKEERPSYPISKDAVREDLLDRKKEERACCEKPCVEWQGRKNAKGYGVVLINGKQFFAHRLAVALSGRNIPSNKVCDHLCRNHGCINPEHLELVSTWENVSRGESPPARAAKRDRCAKGHEYSVRNTRLSVDKRGRTARHCRKCYAARERALEAVKKQKT